MAKETSKRTGSRMKILSWAAFDSMFEHANPFLSLFEVLKNSWQAWTEDCGDQHPIIDIYPDKNGRVVVVDNGIGVAFADVKQRIGAFGDTSKKAGAEEGENLGWGASITLSFQNRENGALFTTWQKGQAKASQCLVSLDEQGAPALLEYGKPSKDVREVQKPIKTPNGTMVMLGDMEFDADLLDYEIGARFPRFASNGQDVEAEIRIHDSDPFASGYKGTPRIVRPIATRAAKAQSTTMRDELRIDTCGRFETPHAVVDWYILESPPSTLSHCYETWNGEVYESYRGSGFVSTMSAYGVWAAHDRVVLVVSRKNPPDEPGIVTDLLRNETKNWDRQAAQAECRAVICLPDHPLFHFMDWWSSNQEDNRTDDSGVRKILDAWKPPASKIPGKETDDNPAPPKPNPDDDEKPTPDNPVVPDPDEEKKKRKKSKRRRRTVPEESGEAKVLTRPRAMMVGRTDMGSDPVRYIPDRNVIKINREVGDVADLIAEARETPNRSQERCKELIKAHMIHAVLSFNEKTGRLPGEEGDEFSLLMAISCPTAAISYVRGTAPKRKTSTSKKKKSS